MVCCLPRQKEVTPTYIAHRLHHPDTSKDEPAQHIPNIPRDPSDTLSTHGGREPVEGPGEGGLSLHPRVPDPMVSSRQAGAVLAFAVTHYPL